MSKKISELDASNQVHDGDLLVIVDTSGTPTNKSAQVVQLATPDASSSVKGKIRLTGDLSGTASTPLVVALRGIPITSSPPAQGDTLIYDSSSSSFLVANPLKSAVEVISLLIELPIAKSYTLDVSAPYPYTINTVTAKLASGTLTASFSIDGSPITGLSNVSVSTTRGTATATASNSTSTGSLLSMTLSSFGGTPADLAVNVRMARL